MAKTEKTRISNKKSGKIILQRFRDIKDMWILFLQIVAGILGIFLAQKYVPGVEFTGNWQTLVLTGTILGLINFFIKPILRIITLPLRILTLGLFGLVINMLMVWLVDILFPELRIAGLIPLFWTTIIICLLSLFLGLYQSKKELRWRNKL